MEAKLKAIELIDKMKRPLNDDYIVDYNPYYKECALIAVDEIIKAGPTKIVWEDDYTEIPILDEEWWEKVKQEIEAL